MTALTYPQDILTCNDVSIAFGGLKALLDVSFSVKRNQVTSIIGPNGAGKTTLFNCITGFYKVSAGDICYHDVHSQRTRINGVLGEQYRLDDFKSPKQFLKKSFYKAFGGSHQVSRLGIARTFQNIRLFNDMTVLENLLVAQHLSVSLAPYHGIFRTKTYRNTEKTAVKRAYELLEFVDLVSQANRLAGELAYGQQRRIEIARALATKPRLICLDEPAAGLNPQETASLKDIINGLKRDFNASVLLIEHDMGLVMDISDVVVVLDHGEVISTGTPEQVKADPKVIAAYLGVEVDDV